MFKDVLELVIKKGYYVSIKGFVGNIFGEHLIEYKEGVYSYRGRLFDASFVKEIHFGTYGVEIVLI